MNKKIRNKNFIGWTKIAWAVGLTKTGFKGLLNAVKLFLITTFLIFPLQQKQFFKDFRKINIFIGGDFFVITWMRFGFVTVKSSPTIWISVAAVNADQPAQSSWKREINYIKTNTNKKSYHCKEYAGVDFMNCFLPVLNLQSRDWGFARF